MLSTTVNIKIGTNYSSFNVYLVIRKWITALIPYNYSRHYLRLDTGIFYITLIQPKVHSSEEWEIPPEHIPHSNKFFTHIYEKNLLVVIYTENRRNTNYVKRWGGNKKKWL